MSTAPDDAPFAELLPFGFVTAGRERRSVGRRLLAGLRALVAGLLALAVALVTTASVLGMWVRDQVLDTDAYVAAVTPVATSPAVQDDVSRQVADAVLGELERAQVPPTVRGALADPVRAAAGDLVRRSEFTGIWAQVNRAGHEAVVRLVRRDPRPVEGAQVVDGRLRVDLTAALDPVRDEIQRQVDEAVASSGLPVTAPRLPRTALVVDAGDVSGLERLQRWVTWVDRSARWGPWAAALLTALAVALARRRLRMLAVVALLVVVAMVAARLALDLGTTQALPRLDAAGVPRDVAPVVVERLTSLLRDRTRWVGIGASVVLALAGIGAVAAASRRSRRPAPPAPAVDEVPTTAS